jgi:hypothetical protein
MAKNTSSKPFLGKALGGVTGDESGAGKRG